MARNGQKWAYFTCNLLQMLDPTGEHVLKKMFFLAPPFLGARGGPIRYFLGKNGSKMLKNDQNGLEWAYNCWKRSGLTSNSYIYISLINFFTLLLLLLCHWYTNGHVTSYLYINTIMYVCLSVCLSVCLYVGVRTTFFWKELETCGFLQKFRQLSEHVVIYKSCPSGHFSGRKLAGTGPDWSENEWKSSKMGWKRA